MSWQVVTPISLLCKLILSLCRVQSHKVKPLNKSVVLRFSPWASLKELLKQNLQFYVYYGFNVHQNQVGVFLSTDTKLTHTTEEKI